MGVVVAIIDGCGQDQAGLKTRNASTVVMTEKIAIDSGRGSFRLRPNLFMESKPHLIFHGSIGDCPVTFDMGPPMPTAAELLVERDELLTELASAKGGDAKRIYQMARHLTRLANRLTH